MLDASMRELNSGSLSITRSLVRSRFVFNDIQRQIVSSLPLQPFLTHLQRDISVAVLCSVRREGRIALQGSAISQLDRNGCIDRIIIRIPSHVVCRVNRNIASVLG